MNQIYNPAPALRGVFVPLWLLARPEIDQGAKLTYSLLAQRVSPKGLSRIYIPALAADLGEEEEAAAGYLNELDGYGLIRVQKEPAEPDLLRYTFRVHPWMGLILRRGEGGEHSSGLGGAASRHSWEDCVRYARAKKEAGEGIRNIFALATHFYKTGKQDEEISIFSKVS
jgi:hypothetical protein